MNNLKLKSNAPTELNDAKKGYKVTGTTGSDQVVVTENTKSSTFNLNKGADQVTFPKPLDAYNLSLDKKGSNVTFTDKVSKQAFTLNLDNKDLDKIMFKDGFASLGIVNKSIQFGKLNLKANQNVDLKEHGSKIGLSPVATTPAPEITLKFLGAENPNGIMFNEDAGKQAFITAQLSAPLKKALTIQVSTEDISAQAKVDYKPLLKKSFTIPANKTEVKIPIALINDPKSFEVDEQFALKVLKISNPAVKLVQDKVTVTLHDVQAPTNNTGGSTTPTNPTDNTGGSTTPTNPTDNTGGSTTPTNPTDNTGGSTTPNGDKMTVSLDGKGTQDTSVKLDAGTGSFNFTDDIKSLNNVELVNFGADDTLTIIGGTAKQYDNGISSENDTVSVIYNNNGILNIVDLVGVKGFVYDVASLNGAGSGQITFA